MNKEQIEAIIAKLRALEAEATPVPWGVPMTYAGAEQITALTDCKRPYVLCEMNWHMERYKSNRNLIIAMRNALPGLLDALEEADGKIKRAIEMCPNGGNDGYITPRPCQCEVESIEADRDQWKARAEALESRYNELWDDATSGAFLQCPTCGNRNKGIIPTPCRNCIGVKGNWKWRHEERSGEE